eukprot:GFYU01003886.1.p1 GENE.GFYU01003886.1~~GFYU01003886.1.p1  ORF type:complete len:546 (-),score=116.20 GFYU01003886.1:168-1805(-)
MSLTPPYGWGEEPGSEVEYTPLDSLGADTVRDIVKSLAKEKEKEAAPIPRVWSAPNLEEAGLSSSDFALPGGFRRQFIAQKESVAPRRISFDAFITNIQQSYPMRFLGPLYSLDDDEDEHLSVCYEQLGEEGTVQPAPAPGSLKTFVVLLKCFAGTGILVMPKSFQNGGLVASTILLPLVGLLATYCMLLLVKCRQSTGKTCHYDDIGYYAYGEWARWCVQFSLTLFQMGCVCAYFIFIAKNMKTVLETLYDCATWSHELEYSTLMLLQVIVFVPLTWIRRLKYLALPSLLADVFVVYSLAAMYGYSIKRMSESGVDATVHYNVEIGSLPLALGASIYAFEGIGLILPIEEAMKESEKHKFPWILGACMLIVTFMYESFALVNYLAYGADTKDVIFLNLPGHNDMVVSVQISYCIAVIFTFPLMLFPAVQIIERKMFQPGKSTTRRKWLKNGERAAVVLLLCAVSIVGVDSFDKFVSIIGSFCGVPLGFIYPALFHYKMVAKTQFQRASDLVVVGFGVIIMILVTAMSILSWAQDGGEVVRDQCS